MKQNDCPAWWLHEALTKLKAQPGEMRIREAYAKAFGLDTDEVHVVFKTLGSVLDSVDQFEDRLGEIPNINQTLYRRSFPGVRKSLSLGNLEEQWGRRSGVLSEAVIADFAFVADLLSTHDPEDRIPQDDIIWISSEVDELFALIHEADLPPSLKRSVLELLKLIRDSISAYRIRGAKALKVALHAGLGELMRNHESVKQKKGVPVIDRFLALLLRLDSIVTKAEKMGPLLGPVLNSLLGPG